MYEKLESRSSHHSRGLLLLGIMVKGGINNFVNKDRVVSVKGLAEMEVPADKVVWPLVYKDIGNDPALLYANMEKKTLPS